MSKSALTIHKEIEKREYAKTPLGIIEKKLRKFYDDLILNGEKLPEDYSERVYNVREANEKAVQEYVELRLKHDRDAVDDMLLATMTKEWEILQEFNKEND